MTQAVMLTVLMPTYNKEAYIAQAIESILKQKTDFKFRIIIIDDKSTDNSLKIAQQYKRHYQDIITIITNHINEGCLSTTLKCYEHAKTEYFCVLDPDDYWISEYKLQNAIKFLENNRAFTAYMSNTYIEIDSKIKTTYFTIIGNQEFNFFDQDNMVNGHTSGTIFRNVIFKNGVPKKLYEYIGTKYERCYEGDIFRNMVHLHAGKIHCVNDIESVYRITSSGIWADHSKFHQNTLNARFYLAMISYFNNTNVEFFIKKYWLYCSLNFDLLNNIASPEHNSLTYGELSDFYEVIVDGKNYRNSFLPNTVLNKSLVFYLPSRVVGGYEFLFMRLANILAAELNFCVKYIDYEDGFVKKQLSNTEVKFLNLADRATLLKCLTDSCLIAPITMSNEIPQTKNQNTKYIFWYAHPLSIKWLKYRSSFSARKLNNFLKKLANIKAIYFMDWACWDMSKYYSNIKFRNVYLPVFTDDKPCVPAIEDIHIINPEEINIGWLGRLDSDKIFSLINVLDNFYNLVDSRKKNIHIIGDGDSKHLIDKEKYSNRLNIIFTSTLIADELYKYLLLNIDILFAMGISSLEAASLKIPAVLTFASTQPMDINEFLWIFNSKGYSLGYYQEQRQRADVKTISFGEIINEVYINNRKQELGLASYNYFLRNHHIKFVVLKLISLMVNMHYSYTRDFLYIIRCTKFGRLLIKIAKYMLRNLVSKYRNSVK